MKKRIISFYLLVTSLILVLSSCENQVISGDGNIVTKTVGIFGYTGIDVGGASIKVIYTQSDAEPFLQVTVDQNIFDMYKFEVNYNGRLIIAPKNGFCRRTSFRPTEFTVVTNSRVLTDINAAGKIEINIDGPLVTDELTFSLAGSGSINIKRLEANRVQTKISGSAHANISQLYCGEFKSKIAGSGKMALAGTADQAHFSITGSSKIRAFDFVVAEMNADIMGSGNIDIHVTKSIRVKVAGSGTVNYKGNPETINRKVSGSGKINKID